jgi:NAD(P)H-dependent FMN reductase
MTKQLLIIWDSMTGGSRALAEAAANAAQSNAQIVVRSLHAADATADDMIAANGYIFICPENLAAISGVMKAFFDRAYYPCLGAIEGRSFAVIICAGSDGRNAAAQIERIATGWRLRKITDSMIVCTHAQTPEQILKPKVVADTDLQHAQDLGTAFAEGLAIGIY